MRVIESIEAKKNGEELPNSSIREIVAGFTNEEIPDYQMSAWLMAVAIQGMTLDETIAFTGAMVDSGDRLKLSTIPGTKVDKHSSGGVGDKVTLALVPILAAAGVPIAKMSGHGLGYTGGTLDKLESIPGFCAELSEEQILRQVATVGACICAQSDRLVPADRAIYALRDVTGTVASAPLVASSIMSKKIACGADAIVLDIKVGSGAFMKNLNEARELAHLCVQIAQSYGKILSCFLTEMDQPLGREIGNANEVAEIADLLQGKPSDPRLMTLIIDLCREAFLLADVKVDPKELIRSGQAWRSFQAVIKAQGGDLNRLPNTATVPSTIVIAKSSGYISKLDALEVGHVAALLGAGRSNKAEKIDPLAGVSLAKVLGDRVEVGEHLATLRSSNPATLNLAAESLLAAYEFADSPLVDCPLIYERISSN